MSVTHKHLSVVKNFWSWLSEQFERHEKTQKEAGLLLFGSTAVRRNVEGRASLK